MIATCRKVWRDFRRTVFILFGLLVFFIGLLTFPLPLPLGIPLLLISMVILLRHSSHARLSFRKLKHWSLKHHKSNAWLKSKIRILLEKIEWFLYRRNQKIHNNSAVKKVRADN